MKKSNKSLLFVLVVLLLIVFGVIGYGCFKYNQLNKDYEKHEILRPKF